MIDPVSPPEFSIQVGKVLGEHLRQHGYDARGAHVRPRGVALEFGGRCGEAFVVLEEEHVVIVDVVRPLAEQFVRISVNELEFFAKPRRVMKPAPWESQLVQIAQRMEERWEAVLAGDPASLDARCRHPMSPEDREGYLRDQRGQPDQSMNKPKRARKEPNDSRRRRSALRA